MGKLIGSHLSDSEQLLGFTAYIHHLARVKWLSTQGRAIDPTANGLSAFAGYTFVRIKMNDPDAISAIRKYQPTFDPKDLTITATSFSGHISTAAHGFVNALEMSGEFNFVKTLPIFVQAAVCGVMLQKMFGVTAAEILLPSIICRSEHSLRQLEEKTRFGILCTLTGHCKSLFGVRHAVFGSSRDRV